MKEVQWPIPMVWPPERATTSVASRFLVASLVRRTLVLLVGAGRLSNVVSLVAKFSPSRLPNGTSYSGPPDCGEEFSWKKRFNAYVKKKKII